MLTAPANVRYSRNSGQHLLTMSLSGFGKSPAQINGQSMSALPSTSDINLFCNRNRIVNFDAQIANSALDLGMAEQ